MQTFRQFPARSGPALQLQRIPLQTELLKLHRLRPLQRQGLCHTVQILTSLTQSLCVTMLCRKWLALCQLSMCSLQGLLQLQLLRLSRLPLKLQILDTALRPIRTEHDRPGTEHSAKHQQNRPPKQPTLLRFASGSMRGEIPIAHARAACQAM